MLLQPDKLDFIVSLIKEILTHASRNHGTLTKNREVNNKHKNRDGNLKTIFSVWCFNCNRFPDGRITKHKSILCEHGGMQQWLVNYWEAYATVVSWMNVVSLLAMASIHKFPSR